jgi:hypothetical protein
MSRKKPDIFVPNTFLGENRKLFSDLILNTIIDTFIYEFNPTSISLDMETQTLFTLRLENKRFLVDLLQVDTLKDYIDIYLFGVKQPQDRYNITVDGDNILINFIVDITRTPIEVLNTDFIVKGKIVEIENG